MTKGTTLTGGVIFLTTFGITKLFGGKTSTAFMVGASLGIASGATFEYIIAPMVVAKVKQDAINAAKKMNQAQADAIAAEAKATVFESDRKAKIQLLALANYTYKDGKAIKNSK